MVFALAGDSTMTSFMVLGSFSHTHVRVGWRIATERQAAKLTRPPAWRSSRPPSSSSSHMVWTIAGGRSEERRVGKSVSVRVDLGGRRIIKKKTVKQKHRYKN